MLSYRNLPFYTISLGQGVKNLDTKRFHLLHTQRGRLVQILPFILNFIPLFKITNSPKFEQNNVIKETVNSVYNNFDFTDQSNNYDFTATDLRNEVVVQTQLIRPGLCQQL